MRRDALYAGVASLLLAATQAIHLLERSAQPAVVGFDLQKKHTPAQFARSRLRRRASGGPATVVLDNEKNLYFTNASLGTPPQQLRFHLDTGSSDLWTNAPNSRLCEARGDLCGDSGTYDANQSSTYKYVNSNFKIAYVDQSGAAGDYVTDTLHLGSVDLPALQFGIGYISSSGESILGIGYPSNEAQVVRGVGTQYRNLPELMANSGLIKSNAYSLWLNDLDAATGSILFGGVNTDKYHGDLATLPIQKAATESNPSQFFITLTELSFNQNGQDQAIASDRADPVLLDSGSTLTYLPATVATDIFQSVGAEYDDVQQSAYVDCGLQQNSTVLNFKFTQPVISVPMNELVMDPDLDSQGSPVTLSDGKTPACLFGIAPATQGSNVLGDTFLRSAYVVYDLTNNQISIAQTNFNSTTDHVLEIGTGKQSVPNASPVTNAVDAAVTGSGGRIGKPTTTVTDASAAPSPTKKGDAMAGQKVSGSILTGLVGAGIFFVLW